MLNFNSSNSACKCTVVECPVNCQACTIDSTGLVSCTTCVASYVAKTSNTCDCKFLLLLLMSNLFIFGFYLKSSFNKWMNCVY